MIKRVQAKVIFFLGPPACGKGTQSEILCRTFNFKHLSAGELLRRELKRNSNTSILIKKCMEEGTIVPVEITCSLLKEEMIQNGWDEKYLFLIDGFPRNNDNFDGWMRTMSQESRLIATINLTCERQVLLERVKIRSEKEKRIDDKVEIFNSRMNGYLNETVGVVKRLSEIAPLIEINANDTKEKIAFKIKNSIKLLI